VGDVPPLSQTDRKALLAYARDRISAVTNDEEPPTMRDQHGEAIPAETVELMLCQRLVSMADRAPRLLEVYNAALEYARGYGGPKEPLLWRALRDATLKALKLEKQEEEATA
jgi:hypothetical protein